MTERFYDIERLKTPLLTEMADSVITEHCLEQREAIIDFCELVEMFVEEIRKGKPIDDKHLNNLAFWADIIKRDELDLERAFFLAEYGAVSQAKSSEVAQ